jgi:hypothetical protein
MKAIILVGGYGTRMRPLTFHCPKPIFPFISKTPVEYMVEVCLLALRHWPKSESRKSSWASTARPTVKSLLR